MLKMKEVKKVKTVKTVTLPVNDLKQAFRRAFPEEKVTGLSKPWMAFWGHVLKKGTLSETVVETPLGTDMDGGVVGHEGPEGVEGA